MLSKGNKFSSVNRNFLKRRKKQILYITLIQQFLIKKKPVDSFSHLQKRRNTQPITLIKKKNNKKKLINKTHDRGIIINKRHFVDYKNLSMKKEKLLFLLLYSKIEVKIIIKNGN